LPVLLVAYHGKIDAKFGPTVEHFVRSRKLRIVVRSYDLDKISGKLKLAVDGISAKNFGTEPYLSLSGFGKSTPLRGTTDMTQVAQWLAAQMGQ
jgi:hypothetical protein